MAPLPGFLVVALIASAKAVARFARVLSHRRAAQNLAEWDSRELKDIGLTRGDVHFALSLPLTRDPTEHLAQLAAGRGRKPRMSRAVLGASPSSDRRLSRPGELPSAGPALCT